MCRTCYKTTNSYIVKNVIHYNLRSTLSDYQPKKHSLTKGLGRNPVSNEGDLLNLSIKLFCVYC